VSVELVSHRFYLVSIEPSLLQFGVVPADAVERSDYTEIDLAAINIAKVRFL
jgi:hypothetical protein